MEYAMIRLRGRRAAIRANQPFLKRRQNMDRRHFFQAAAAGAATTVLVPTRAFAEAPGMAGGVFYTKEAPGRWAQKAATHLPIIEATKSGADAVINVTTPHEMKGFEHYIVKHTVLDGNYKFIAEHMFDPTKDKAPMSTFNLGNYKGTVYALSMCNKHDVWLASASV
jgi:superoxide reductase